MTRPVARLGGAAALLTAAERGLGGSAVHCCVDLTGVSPPVLVLAGCPMRRAAPRICIRCARPPSEGMIAIIGTLLCIAALITFPHQQGLPWRSVAGASGVPSPSFSAPLPASAAADARCDPSL